MENRIDEILERYGEVRRLSPGEVLCRQSEVSDGVYYLKSGWLGVYREEGEDAYLLSIVGPGEVVGELGATTGRRRTATVISAKECEVILISEADFQRAMKEAPELVATVIGTMGNRLTNADTVRITLSQSYHRAVDRVRALGSQKARLEEVLRLREELADMIVHDLRNPLGVISTGLDLLERVRVVESDSQYARMVMDTLRQSANRMQALVDTLLDIARLEEAVMTLNLLPIDLGALVEDVITEELPLAEKGNVVLESRVPASLPMVLADRGVIQRVLVNLVDNALKFTPAGGQVWIEAQPQAEYVQIEVLDTGTGVPPEERARIFEKFTRVQGQGEAKSKSGVGLGLAFCQMAVDAHGGWILVEDGPEGRGSRFIFALPKAHTSSDD